MRVSITHTVKWRALLCITAALTAAAIVGCRKFDEPTPTPAPPAADTMSLADLHDLCRDTTLEIDEQIVVGGYVTSSDAASNFYKTFTIEDASGGAEIMAGITGLHNIYPEGYYITVSLSGCAAGEHYGVMQIGLAPESYDYYPTAYFSARAVIDRHVMRSDVRHEVAPRPVTIEEMHTDMCGCLVSAGGLRCVTSKLFQDTWEANPDGTWHGYNFFADAAGNVIAVYTSDYADYASHAVPSGYVAIKGILQRGKIGGGEYFMIKMRDETDCTPLD